MVIKQTYSLEKTAQKLHPNQEWLKTARESMEEYSYVPSDAIQPFGLMEQVQETIDRGREEAFERLAEIAMKSDCIKHYLFIEIVGALSSLCGNRYYNTSSDEDSGRVYFHYRCCEIHPKIRNIY